MTSLGECRHEVFVVRQCDESGNQTGKILKLKSPYHTDLKVFGGKQDINQAFARIGNMKEHLDEEFYRIIDVVKSNRDYFQGLNEQERPVFMQSIALGSLPK